MTRLEFFKDKGVFLGCNSILFLIVILAFLIMKLPYIIMVFVFSIWFTPLLLYMELEYHRYHRYITKLYTIVEQLDNKFLLPEVVEEEEYGVEKHCNAIMKVICRDMHEQIKKYQISQQEYREYIELWVHEIKTPIASSKLIIENNPNPTTRKMEQQLELIENYIEQVLYYSKSDEVAKDYIIKRIPLSTVVKDVIKRNKKDFIGKRIPLQLESLECVVYSDTKWLEFILNQLIGNAIKYSKEKDNKITIAAEEKNNAVILIIKDQGVGIVKQDLGRVFEKGFTGNNGRLFGKGTGMGLYLCKKLCDKLGMGLRLESEEGQGTTVSIIFPKSEELGKLLGRPL